MTDSPRPKDISDDATVADGRRPGDAEPVAVATIGRFQIEREIGAGGMGRVFAAHDPELERTVAVKLLRDEGFSSLEQRARFLREAKAMAKLRHPNVVTVHEAGEHDGRPFIAMELLEGQNLSVWLRESSRSWREVRDLFVAAGNGLAAAHAAGLVHRDFKPSNVWVGPAGVRVLDFGLASTAPEESGPVNALGDDLRLTRTGSMIGTPIYMSPEQLRGERATTRSDQWSFCVALYEGLYGIVPFTGRSAEEMLGSMQRGAVFPAGPPRFLVALLRRGFALDPAARHPSMTALLAELAHDPRRIVRLSLGGGAAIAGAVALFLLWPAREEPCKGARAHLVGVWDDAARGGLRGAFAATGKPFAEDVYRRVAARLDGYAEEWVAGHTAACEASRVRGEQSGDLLDRRMHCLDRLRGGLGSLVAALSRDIDADGLQRAVDATRGLGDVAECANVNSLRERPARPADPELRRRVDEIERRLSQESARGRLRDPIGATRAVEPLVADAEATAYPPLRAQAHWVYGSLLAMSTRFPEAAAELERAIRLAEDASDGPMAARAWVVLIGTLGYSRKPDDVLRLELAAEAAIRRIGSPPDLLGELDIALCEARRLRGELDEARRLAERALTRFTGPNDGHGRVKVWTRLGQIAHDAQDLPAAAAAARKLIDEATSTFGPDHTFTAHAHQHLGASLMYQGATDEAERELVEAGRIYALVFGEDNHQCGNNFMMLSVTRMRAGRLAGAAEAIERAIAILDRGEPTTGLANAVEQQGNIALEDRRLADARAAYERGLALRRKLLGDDHPNLSMSYLNLGSVAFEEDRFADAAAHCRQAVAILEAKKVSGPRLGSALVQLARAEYMLGRAKTAVATLERAMPNLAGGDELVLIEADEIFSLALWEAGDRRRAFERAIAARERCARTPVHKRVCATVENWLAKHGR